MSGIVNSGSLLQSNAIYVDPYQAPTSDATPSFGTSTSPYPTITEALNEIVENGDNNSTGPYTLFLAPGIYNESIDLSNPALRNIFFVGYGATIVGFDVVPALQAINNDNLTDVCFIGVTFKGQAGAPYLINFQSSTNGTNFLSGTSFGQGAAFYDCMFSAQNISQTMNFQTAGGVVFDRCFIDTAYAVFTNVYSSFTRNGSGWAQGCNINLVTNNALPTPNGFSNTNLGCRSQANLATVTVGAGSAYTLGMGARQRSAVTVNGTFNNQWGIVTAGITVNSGGVYTETYGGSHGTLIINSGGSYTMGGTLGIGTIMLNGSAISSGVGSPNGVVVGNPGDYYTNKSGGANTTLWVKESGVGTNTGWVAK